MPDIEPKDLGKLVTKLRESHGYSVPTLAKMMSVNHKTLRLIERGVSIPYQRTIRALTDILSEGSEAFKSFKSKSLKPTTANSFGAFLRDIRIDRNLGEPELATSIGIAQTLLSSYELNKSLPSMHHLELLMEELGFTPENPEELAVNRGRPKKINPALQTPTIS